MKRKKNIVQYSLGEFIGLSRKSKTDWSRVLRMTPAEIERNATSDVDDFTNDPEFWKNARLVYPVPKDKISLRLDRDILRHFKKQGRGYQSLINAILKAYVATKENGKR
jgi:uncharacterized protein (DUF4415 family)